MKRILIVIFIISLVGAGIYFGLLSKFKSTTTIQKNPIAVPEVKKNIQYLPLEKAEDLGFFKQGVATFDSDVSVGDEKPKRLKIITYYDYFKYAEIVSGDYKDYKIYLVRGNYSSNFNDNVYTPNYSIKNEKENYKINIIAVKDGKFLTFEELGNEDKKTVITSKYLGFKNSFLINEIKNTFEIGTLNTLTKENVYSALLRDLEANPKVKLVKEDLKVGEFNTYKLVFTEKSEDYTSTANHYFIDFNGLAVFYSPTVSNTEYFSSIPSSKLNTSGIKHNLYEYFNYSCSIAIINLATLNPDIGASDNLEKINTDNNFNLYRVKDLKSKQNKGILDLLTKGYFYKSEKINYDTLPKLSEFENDGFLVYQDPFGIYRGLVQNDTLEIRGGCGKPVIYLYPEQDTKVSLKFNNKIKFTTFIPEYQDSWEVLAKTNGILKDLKPELTDCNSLSNSFGSEYAKSACEKNEYPYLYWSGNTENSFYPEAKTGFIVRKEDLDQFFNEKLSLMNFNQKEISDFKEYWVSYLSQKDSAYFRITFFQNNIVNKLFPMNISPKPSSSIRLFMDWDYASKETIIPQQNLISYPRVGFTLIEWGGLKK